MSPGDPRWFNPAPSGIFFAVAIGAAYAFAGPSGVLFALAAIIPIAAVWALWRVRRRV